MALYSQAGRQSMIARTEHNVEVLKQRKKRSGTLMLHSHSASRHEQAQKEVERIRREQELSRTYGCSFKPELNDPRAHLAALRIASPSRRAEKVAAAANAHLAAVAAADVAEPGASVIPPPDASPGGAPGGAPGGRRRAAGRAGGRVEAALAPQEARLSLIHI